jgi:hypothetical protein
LNHRSQVCEALTGTGVRVAKKNPKAVPQGLSWVIVAALNSGGGMFGAGQLLFGGKAPDGWRIPKRFASFGCVE